MIPMKITLLGLGSILMRDDGVGVQAVKAVQERFEVPPELDIVDGGTSGLDLLPFLEGRDRVLFVDAVDFGQEPGFMGELENDAIPAFFVQNKASLHHIGLADVLATARLMNILPPEICLIGIQPQVIEMGLELTEVMQGKLDLLVSRITEKLQDWGVHLVPRYSTPTSS
jgi:hydrogenase maturation protease